MNQRDRPAFWRTEMYRAFQPISRSRRAFSYSWSSCWIMVASSFVRDWWSCCGGVVMPLVMPLVMCMFVLLLLFVFMPMDACLDLDCLEGDGDSGDMGSFCGVE